eukprot:g28802.t1
MDNNLSHTLGLESAPESNSPVSSCFDPDPMEAGRLEMGGHKGLELTGNAGWDHSDMSTQVIVKQEPSDPRLVRAVGGHTYGLPFEQCDEQLPKRADGKLDSFNKVFANRHSLGHSSSAAGSYTQSVTLRQMLSQKAPAERYPQPRVSQHMPCMPTNQQAKVLLPQSLHYSYPQLRRMAGPQQLPTVNQQMAQDILQQPTIQVQHHQLHKPSGETKQHSDNQHQMGPYHQAQQSSHHQLLQHMPISREPVQRPINPHQCQPGKFEPFHHSFNAPPQFLYGERQHYRVEAQQTETLTHQLYQKPSHSSPGTSVSPGMYLTS